MAQESEASDVARQPQHIRDILAEVSRQLDRLDAARGIPAQTPEELDAELERARRFIRGELDGQVTWATKPSAGATLAAMLERWPTPVTDGQLVAEAKIPYAPKPERDAP